VVGFKYIDGIDMRKYHDNDFMMSNVKIGKLHLLLKKKYSLNVNKDNLCIFIIRKHLWFGHLGFYFKYDVDRYHEFKVKYFYDAIAIK